MAEITTSLRSFLVNNPDVYGVFGQNITCDRIPDSPTYPHARIRLISPAKQRTLENRYTTANLMQIDIYDNSEAGADEAKETMHDALDGYHGTIGDYEVGYCFANYGPNNYDEIKRLYWRILEVSIGTSS